MKKIKYSLLLLVFFSISSQAQSSFAVNGLCIAAPATGQLDEFVEFIDNEIAPAGINTLILRVDFNYAYESRPELRDKNPLTKEQVKQLVAVCKKNQIKLIPQVNLLGHQSWASTLNKLLAVYPEFDETPHVKIPEKYEWPNDDGLYCKSYCPLHPGVHDVVFDLMDEIVAVFEADAFHAGMDEVFYLADEKCPRCMGKDPAQLYAGEVTKISDHLTTQNAKLWIWGDRLIDASTSGIGMWATFACGQPEGGAPDRPQLRVADVSYDPAGDDTGSLDDEWVEIVNESYGTVNMSGWTVRDESSSNRFVLPSTSVNPGNTLRIVTGCGTDGGGILHWCSDTPVWNNDGDTVILQDELGNTVDHWPYAGP